MSRHRGPELRAPIISDLGGDGVADLVLDRASESCALCMRTVLVEVVMLEFDRGAPKRATNLSFNSDLLRRAKGLGINLSARLEPELIRIVAEEEQRKLAQELAPTVAAWAAYYETHSAVADDWSEV